MLLIKAGGGKGINWEAVCRDVAEIQASRPVILVHGASTLRDEIAARLSVPVRTVMSPSGVTSVYTDAEAIEVFLMAYAGLANKRLVARLLRLGVKAVGLSGVDGRLWEAAAKKDLLVQAGGKTKLLRDNLTGRVEKINAPLLRLLVENGYVPVLCAPAITAAARSLSVLTISPS
jgi:acetylglutamate/LysW-gamma-L-alpha-aminoadipate kinase